MSIVVIQITAIKEKDNDLESTENFLSCSEVITTSGFLLLTTFCSQPINSYHTFHDKDGRLFILGIFE